VPKYNKFLTIIQKQIKATMEIILLFDCVLCLHCEWTFQICCLNKKIIHFTIYQIENLYILHFHCVSIENYNFSYDGIIEILALKYFKNSKQKNHMI